jgi:hypothetical protein
MAELALVPAARTVRRWDVAAVLYVVVLGALAVAIGSRVWALGELNQGLGQAADALDATARALGLAAQVPLVGQAVGDVAGSVTGTAAQVRAGGVAAQHDLHLAAVGIGVAIALLPVPMLLVYVPLRLARRRELRGLRRLLTGPIDPSLVAHLAHAAVRRVPYTDLRRLVRARCPAKHRDCKLADR